MLCGFGIQDFCWVRLVSLAFTLCPPDRPPSPPKVSSFLSSLGSLLGNSAAPTSLTPLRMPASFCF